MAECTETLLYKKLDCFGNEKVNNFKEESELTVEITLSEYRMLVSEYAIKKYKISEAEQDRYKRESENGKLKERVKELEMSLFEYRKAYGDIKKEVE